MFRYNFYCFFKPYPNIVFHQMKIIFDFHHSLNYLSKKLFSETRCCNFEPPRKSFSKKKRYYASTKKSSVIYNKNDNKRMRFAKILLGNL